jgi:hypothetical protein
MKKLRAIAGYTWAVLTIPLVVVTFVGLPFWEKTLVGSTGLRVSPWFTGGEVRATVDHGRYQTSIHHPVFEGLLCQYSAGFVQIDWGPPGALPEQIAEDVDLDGAGRPAFHVELATRDATAVLRSLDPRVENLIGVYRLKNALAIRVRLRNNR